MSRRTSFYGQRTTCSVRKDNNWILYLLTRPTLVIGSSVSLLWEMMLWLSVSVSCIRYSRRRKFRPKMRREYAWWKKSMYLITAWYLSLVFSSTYKRSIPVISYCKKLFSSRTTGWNQLQLDRLTGSEQMFITVSWSQFSRISCTKQMANEQTTWVT